MTEQKPMEELSFREAMTQLEGIVSLLESNTLELEDSLKNYERGVALLASLQKRLTAADQQVQVLVGELIVSLLESNTLELEDSLKNYERGVALLASLQKRLTAADQQVQVLVGELSSLGSDAEQDTTLS